MVTEEILEQHGLVPDIDDNTLGVAYESCPAVQRSLLKNALAFAHVVAQAEVEPLAQSCRLGHFTQNLTHSRLDWAFFAVDVRCFPVTAIATAFTLALAAKVKSVVVHVSGPVSTGLLCACDLLSLEQIFVQDPLSLVSALQTSGPGVFVDLARLSLPVPRVLQPNPEHYGVRLLASESEYSTAYRSLTTETLPQPFPYIAYGGNAGDAPVVMAERLLGCWLWDVLSPSTFYRTTSIFT